MTKTKTIESLVFPKTCYDNTILSDYRRCERYGYWRHIRGLVTDTIKAELKFGSAWHAGHDVGWPMVAGSHHTNDLLAEAAKVAFEGFMKYWKAEGMPIGQELLEQYDTLSPHLPETAERMYQHYYKIHSVWLSRIELLDTEASFVVPLYKDDLSIGYIGLIDKKIRHWQGDIIPVDHKSTKSYSKDHGFRYEFMQGFQPNSQMEGYHYAMDILHPGEVNRVWIDASLVHKNKDIKTTRNDVHQIIPIQQPVIQINDWLKDARITVERIEEGKETLLKGEHCFPKNTNACTYYGMCPYLDICCGSADWQEVTEWAGLKYEPWNPVEFVTKGGE